MQVTARVQPAPSSWVVLAAAADIAARADTGPALAAVNLGLARLAVDRVMPDPRLFRLRIDYLRN
jgi:hypothetical protein